MSNLICKDHRLPDCNTCKARSRAAHGSPYNLNFWDPASTVTTFTAPALSDSSPAGGGCDSPAPSAPSHDTGSSNSSYSSHDSGGSSGGSFDSGC